MIERLFPLQFFKKAPYYGSCGAMRYCVRKKEDELEVCVHPGPFAMDHTPEDRIRRYTFPFSNEGLEVAAACLNRAYEDTDWEAELLPWQGSNEQ